jgi:DUF4097 and DUF4098 domain-containing protein YvlB
MTVRTFPLTGPINLAAKLGHGSLLVHCADGVAAATVELTARPGSDEYAERTTVEMTGPTLTITAPRQGGVFDLFGDMWRKNAGVDVVVTVPSGTAMKISTFTAGVEVRGRSGGADIATGSASIDLDEVGGDLRVRSGTATTTVRAVGGSVQLRTGAGDTHFTEIAGDLDCVCGSGQLIADLVRGAVRCRVGSGEARLAAVYGDVDMASGSGPLSVGLPAGVTARLDVQTGSGRVSSELPVGDKPADVSASIAVRARTGSGDVAIRRAA